MSSSSLPSVSDEVAGTYPSRRSVDVRPKEVILVCLALLLLAFSMTLFFKHWKKNYWDINQLPYYAYLYKVSTLFHLAKLLEYSRLD